jgi:hypothetical protein
MLYYLQWYAIEVPQASLSNIIFTQDPIRAVVMANRLILIVPDGADSLLSILDQYMKG